MMIELINVEIYKFQTHSCTFLGGQENDRLYVRNSMKLFMNYSSTNVVVGKFKLDM